ncbi:MAG: efflux RND transporter periplasmic adaptor subunit [Burkholderiaceae bacterium]
MIHLVIAVAGIAAASAGAWWYQSRPQGPTEITAQQGAARPAGPASAAGANAAPRAAGVEVAKVERARLQDDAQSVGTLRSRQSVMLRPEVAGRVREIGFADGSTVRKGQVLVQLDDTLQRAEIQQSQAQVSIAQANLKRNQELVAQSFVAQRVLEESAANLQVAQAQLALSCARWARMAVLAPFDGTVGIRNVNLGDYVKDGADLVNLEDISSMLADFRLPERFQGKLQARQSVQLQLDAFPGRVFKATVEAIDPLLDVNGRSVGVRAILPNTMGEPLPQAGGRPGGASAVGGGSKPAGAVTARAPAALARTIARAGPQAPASAVVTGRMATESVACTGVRESALAATGGQAGTGAAAAANRPSSRTGPAPLRPGMFARVTTVFSVREQALVVPEEAIVPQGERQFVIKVLPPSQLPERAGQTVPPDTQWVSMRQEVQLGVRQLGKVEIVDGLREGDTVVLAGQQRLQRDGTPLRVIELGRGAQRGAAGAAGARTGAASAPAGGASLATAGN